MFFKFPILKSAVIILIMTDIAIAQTPIIRNEGGGGIINVGQAFGWLEPYVNTLVGSVITFAVGWVLYLTKIDRTGAIDQKHRDALETFLKNQAQALVANGFVRLNGVKVEVDSGALLTAVELGSKHVPDALKWFGMDDKDALAGKIIAKLPQVPSVATAQAASLTEGPVV